MAEDKYLQEFIQECSQSVGSETNEKFVGWETILSVLVMEGLKMLLPELKEWVKLGAMVITTKRLALQKTVRGICSGKKSLILPRPRKRRR